MTSVCTVKRRVPGNLHRLSLEGPALRASAGGEADQVGILTKCHSLELNVIVLLWRLDEDELGDVRIRLRGPSCPGIFSTAPSMILGENPALL